MRPKSSYSSKQGPRFALFVYHTDSAREYAYGREDKNYGLDKGLDAAVANGWTVADMKQELRDSDPSIEVRALFLSNNQLHLTAVALKDGEAEIVTRQIAGILQSHRTGMDA